MGFGLFELFVGYLYQNNVQIKNRDAIREQLKAKLS